MKVLMGAGLAALLLTTGASAKDALCETTDDLAYPCTFEVLDDAGSFEISSEGMPTYQVWVDSPGMATVGAVFEPGGRSVALPGPYRRSEEDGACWVSDATGTQICAW
ncbi:hypothetical protein [Devosia sp.]|uniref:hypothetical protein n=1 Tax=Devosia sp. TaxID=1871048 RepID=UPI002FCB6FFF